MNVLIFGGSGWVGHSIARKLYEEKIPCTIVSRGQKTTYLNEIPHIPSIRADKNNEEDMKNIFASATYTHVIDSVPTPACISLVRKYAKNLQHYIHCSSTGGYAPLPFIPCNETAPYKGFAYGNAWDFKRDLDNCVMDLFRKEGFPATVIRPCYITGPGLLPLDNLGGRRKDFITDIIAENVLDLPGDGSTLLQPIHVKDLANSFFLALMHPLACKGEIYNITLSHALPLNEYLRLTASVFGKQPEIHYMTIEDILAKYGSKVNEIGLKFLACHMCFTTEKARRDLEYMPKYTPEDAIIETALWAEKFICG